MGSDHDYPEERPAHRRAVGGFWMDRGPVTNVEFAAFVDETGYVTTAEKPPNPADYPDADPALLRAGSLVFTPPAGPVPLDDYRRWWEYVPQAHWRCPRGPGSSAVPDHPVVHVSFEDALGYADWAGKSLPTEPEWEWAARGGRPPTRYAWGEEFRPGGVPQANTWAGDFPWRNDGPHAATGTSPVAAFPANDLGLVDLIGNVWEWTVSPASESHRAPGPHGLESGGCCAPVAAGRRVARVRERTIKGGSHLCAPEYCRRYRPAARQAQEGTSSTSHLGFRCVRRPDTPEAGAFGADTVSAQAPRDRPGVPMLTSR